MTILFSPSTIFLNKVIRKYNGDFSGASYGTADPPYNTIYWNNKKQIVLPFTYKNHDVKVEELILRNHIKVYFD